MSDSDHIDPDELEYVRQEFEDWMEDEVRAGRAEVVGLNEKGHRLYRFTEAGEKEIMEDARRNLQ